MSVRRELVFGHYTSKPVAVEALQFSGNTDGLVVPAHMRVLHDTENGIDVALLQVQTINGDWVTVRPGDYIIKERHGDGYYPCDPAHFDERYELAVRVFPTVSDELAYLTDQLDDERPCPHCGKPMDVIDVSDGVSTYTQHVCLSCRKNKR